VVPLYAQRNGGWRRIAEGEWPAGDGAGVRRFGGRRVPRGALLGGLLVPYLPAPALKLVLGGILIVSAIRIFHHARA
jgi:hypothetical protein